MSIALDNHTSVRVNNASSDTTSYTCTGTDLDGRLFVFVTLWGGGLSHLVEDYTITYAGQSLEFVTKQVINSLGLANVGLFMLKNPPAGTANLVTSTNQGNEYFRILVSSWTGVEQDDAAMVIAGDTGTYPDNPSVSVTTAFDDSVVLDCATHSFQNTSMTAGAGQTILDQGELGSGFTSWSASSYESKSTPGAVSMDWTASAPAGEWAQVAVAMKPAGPRMTVTGINQIVFS